VAAGSGGERKIGGWAGGIASGPGAAAAGFRKVADGVGRYWAAARVESGEVGGNGRPPKMEYGGLGELESSKVPMGCWSIC
jgi:hypothetical protein